MSCLFLFVVFFVFCFVCLLLFFCFVLLLFFFFGGGEGCFVCLFLFCFFLFVLFFVLVSAIDALDLVRNTKKGNLSKPNMCT